MAIIRTIRGDGMTIAIMSDTARLDRMMRDAQDVSTLAGAVQKAAFDVEMRAKVLCPVDTGTLANSIRAEQAVAHPGGIIDADIAPHTEYAIYVELGHVHNFPQAGYMAVPGYHYMTRALYTEGPKLDRALRKWVETLGT